MWGGGRAREVREGGKNCLTFCRRARASGAFAGGSGPFPLAVSTPPRTLGCVPSALPGCGGVVLW
jgi:hypothetical protein